MNDLVSDLFELFINSANMSFNSKPTFKPKNPRSKPWFGPACNVARHK